MNRVLTQICIILLVIMVASVGNVQAATTTTPVTLYFPDITLDGSAIWLPQSWNLNSGDVIIRYTIDMRGAANVDTDWNWNKQAIVGLLTPDYSTGARMTHQLADWDSPIVEYPVYPDKDTTLDLDDKFNFQKFPSPGTRDERMYDVYCDTNSVASSPFGSGDNYGIWFDRDGVDPWQDADPLTPPPSGSNVPWGSVAGGNYDSGGIYDIQLIFRSLTDKGTACALFFPTLPNPVAPGGKGIPTGFIRNSDGSYQFFPAGLSFAADVSKKSDMHVVLSGGYPGSIVIKNLTVTGYLNLDEGMATGGGWFVPENDSFLGTSPGGRASFGFVAKQKDTVSSGNLNFIYHVDQLELKSSNYQWVAISSTQVVFEGIGKLNGLDGYRFRVRAVDGDLIGTGVDRFEIRIWTDAGSFDMPTYRMYGNLSGGQVVVHKK